VTITYVVGAGGIGCAVGYALIASGEPVVFVDANEDKVCCGNRTGVEVEGWEPRAATFQNFETWQPLGGATVLLCTKCYDNEIVLNRLPSDTTILPVQNGFDPRLEQRDHLWEGIASFVSECLVDRPRTRITRNGVLHIGPRRPGELAELPLVAQLLRRSQLFRTKVVSNIEPFKYTKLMYNAAISPLAAALGINNGQLLALPKARRQFFDLLKENYEVLSRAGVPLARIGLFHPEVVSRILRTPLLATVLAWAFYPSLRNSYCSMHGDLPRGQTEIDYYNLRLIQIAGDKPCPLNRRIYDLIKRMEANRIAPSPSLLAELI
jgi:2-dehydropantoate 2-reductase